MTLSSELAGILTDISGELPAWIKRLSVQEMVEKTWKLDGEIASPADIAKEKSGFI